MTPNVRYSAVEDGSAMDVLSPRDMLVVYLSIRLAQIARDGALYVRSDAHKKRFNVKADHTFDEAETPVISVGLSGGMGGQGDLGWNFTEERLKFTLTAFSFDKSERDSLTRVLRGLIGEIAWFLGDLGCDEISFGELEEQSVVRQPYGYMTKLAIGVKVYTYIRAVSQGWQLTPSAGWISV